MAGCGTQSSSLADKVRIGQWLDSLRILVVFPHPNELMILLAGMAPARWAAGSAQPRAAATFSPWGDPCARTQHPRVKIEFQLPISGQCEHADRGDLTARQAPACPGKPGQVAGEGHVQSPRADTPQPSRLRHEPMSPSSGHRRDSGATLEPGDNAPALSHGCRLPKPPRREGGIGSSSPPMGLLLLPATSAQQQLPGSAREPQDLGEEAAGARLH